MGGRGGPYWPKGGGAKWEVSTFDLYSSVTSWGHVKRETRSIRGLTVNGKRSVLASSQFSVVRRQTRPVNTDSTQLLARVCVCSLAESSCTKITWPNRNNVSLKKESKGLQLNTHITGNPLWWYLHHSVRQKRKRGSPLTWGEDDLQTSQVSVTSLKFHFAFTLLRCFGMSWSVSTPAEVTIFYFPASAFPPKTP